MQTITPKAIDVHYVTIVEQLAAHNGVGTVEVDGWLSTHPIRGHIYKAPTAAATA